MTMSDFTALWNNFGLPGVIVLLAWRIAVWLGPNVAIPIVTSIKEYLVASAVQQALHTQRMTELEAQAKQAHEMTHSKLDDHRLLLLEISRALHENTEDSAEFRASVEQLLARSKAA